MAMRSGTSIARRVMGRVPAFLAGVFDDEVEFRLLMAGGKWEFQKDLPSGDMVAYLHLRGEVVGKRVVHYNGHFFYSYYWVGDRSFEWVGSQEHRKAA